MRGKLIKLASLPPEENAQLREILIDPSSTEADFKKVARAAEADIKTFMRESSFFENIITPKPITNADLIPRKDSELPYRLISLDINTRGAVTVPFGTAKDFSIFTQRRGAVEYHKVQTPIYQKDVNELRTEMYDVRAEISQKLLNDIDTEIDTDAIAALDTIVGDYDGNGLAGFQQHYKAGATADDGIPDLASGLSRDALRFMKGVFSNLRIPIGTLLMNTYTADYFATLPRDEIGGDMAQATWKEGLKGIGSNVVSGIPFIITIKNDLVPNNVVYAFAEQDFLGVYDVLEDTTVTIKRVEDFIQMSAQRIIGSTIANLAAVAKFDLNPITD